MDRLGPLLERAGIVRRLDRGLGARTIGVDLAEAPAIEAAPRLPGRSQRDAVQPVPQPLRVADRPGLAGQHEEDRLERILGMMAIAQEPAADAQHHRPVPLDQDGEGRLSREVAAGREPLQELAVGQVGDGADLEERLDLSQDGPAGTIDHDGRLPSGKARSGPSPFNRYWPSLAAPIPFFLK